MLLEFEYKIGMGSKELTKWKKAIKTAGYQVRVTRIGAGKHQSLGLCGTHAEVCAQALESAGLTRGALSGDGSNSFRMITLDTV